MVKNIIKEIIIVLLLCLAIVLLLGIIFYDYIPRSKVVPLPVSYKIPESAKKELETNEQANEDNIVMTYEINESDLTNYKRTQNYKPGKTNPFSSYKNDNSTGNSNNGSNGGTTGGSTGNTTDDTNTSGGNLHPDRGGK